MSLGNSSYNNRLTNSTGGASMSSAPTSLSQVSPGIISAVQAAANWASTANPTMSAVTNPISRAMSSIYTGGLGGLASGYGALKGMLGTSSTPPLTVPHVGSGAAPNTGPFASAWSTAIPQAVPRQYAATTPQAGISAPAYKPIKSSGIGSDVVRGGITPISNDLPTAIRQTAPMLGLSPEEWGGMIHYESGFRTNAVNASGHTGLIQFGKNEQKQYGIGASSPVSKQMEAAVQFMHDRGYRPGMGGARAYATINGGNPNAMGLSDYAAGGRPGTAAQKWAGKDMAASRQAAARLLNQGAGVQQVADNTDYGNQALLAPNDPRAVGGIGSDASSINQVDSRAKASAQPWGMAGRSIDTQTGRRVGGEDATLRMGQMGDLSGPFNRLPGADMIADVGKRPPYVAPSTGASRDYALSDNRSRTSQVASAAPIVPPSSAAGHIVSTVKGEPWAASPGQPTDNRISISGAAKKVAGWAGGLFGSGSQAPGPAQTANAGAGRAPTAVSTSGPYNQAPGLENRYGAGQERRNEPVLAEAATDIKSLSPALQQRSRRFRQTHDMSLLAGLDTATKLAFLIELGKGSDTNG